MENKPLLCSLLNIEFPVIMAPMFLVSNEAMIIEGIKAGITGCIPALNYRTTDDLRKAIRYIKKEAQGPFGINLIVNKSNFMYKEQMKVCCEEKVDFFITSLGSPEETINMAHQHGVKVFCDVTDVKYALKVEALGADAIIAVSKEAGGHAGPTSYKQLIDYMFLLDPYVTFNNPPFVNMYKVESVRTIALDDAKTLGDYDPNIAAYRERVNERVLITTDMNTNWASSVPGGANIQVYRFTPDYDDVYLTVTECSNRGLCNTFEGICECFHGYSGAACEVQTAIVS